MNKGEGIKISDFTILQSYDNQNQMVWAKKSRHR